MALNAVKLHMEQLQVKGEASPLATPTLVALDPVREVLVGDEALDIGQSVGISSPHFGPVEVQLVAWVVAGGGAGAGHVTVTCMTVL